MDKKQSSITHLFIYALAFLILWEWLRPIPTITDTGHIEVFVSFALFSCVLIYLRISPFLIIPTILLGSIYGLHYIFHEGPFLSRGGGLETLRFFLSDSWYNIRLIFTWDLALLTDFFRTFLLFMLLALICYLLYFWIFHTKKIFFFLLSTVIYITVLDTFTPVDASMAIIRIIVIGFFIVTLLQMLKIQEEEKAIGKRNKTYISSAWMYTLIFMIVVATSVGYGAPKFDPQWEDPVPVFRHYVLGEEMPGTGGSVRRVGYGENDDRLGGGFVQDFSTVFYAETESASYWRGESKYEYTGHGWVSEPALTESHSLFDENEIDYYLFTDNVETEEREVLITMESGVGFNHLFYPGQLIGLDVESVNYSVPGQSGELPLITFFTDRVAGKVIAHTEDRDDYVVLNEYRLTYQEASFSLNALRRGGDDPESIRERYLQLPEDLPDRVVELAEEIVADYDNRYDMVVAVEQYFSSNDFEYQTVDVPIPEEGQDYVDQFLFETQYGYCDNFSTAMAVLLRAVDIPTRWVKGFTPGEEIERLPNGTIRYEISNNNAHSWVEVYFPEVGWVPFEPTQGFNNNVEFYEEEEEIEENNTSEDNYEDNERELPDSESPEYEQDMGDLEEESGIGSNNDRNNLNFSLSVDFTWKHAVISLIVLGMVMLVYRKINILQNGYFLLHYRLLGKDERFKTAYQRLLWILDNEGIYREDGETLREYAIRVDKILGSNGMKNLTNTYEKIYYGAQLADGEWKKQQKDWEELVRLLNS
ncbi:transglutaminase-like putative cysteine protease [Evansella vedderi]|uniref:Transglutaminase-like putative cysteine protease n=1 Tax=Evansella vedderi TaxID=38282 RepID=A0ABT9ZS80_9BACI|nr:transglutaminase domain-containing protein [Evansella vedderi]MDQ0254084.1 transglutaminase-like putative cysteine protease [Evansella vedderi]